MVSLAPQRGRCTTPHKSKGVFSDILTTASRTNTLYGLETRYIQSSRHVGIIKKVLRLIRHFDVFMTSSMSDFYVNLQFLGYSKYHQVCRNSWFSHTICVLIGSIHLMCNRLCVDEKLPFLVLGKWWTFSSTCSTYPIIITFYQQVHSVKRSKLAKFREDIIYIAILTALRRHTISSMTSTFNEWRNDLKLYRLYQEDMIWPTTIL